MKWTVISLEVKGKKISHLRRARCTLSSPCCWLRYQIGKTSFKVCMPPTTDNSLDNSPHSPSQAFVFTKIPLAPTGLVVEMEGPELQRGGGWGWRQKAASSISPHSHRSFPLSSTTGWGHPVAPGCFPGSAVQPYVGRENAVTWENRFTAFRPSPSSVLHSPLFAHQLHPLGTYRRRVLYMR